MSCRLRSKVQKQALGIPGSGIRHGTRTAPGKAGESAQRSSGWRDMRPGESGKVQIIGSRNFRKQSQASWQEGTWESGGTAPKELLKPRDMWPGDSERI